MKEIVKNLQWVEKYRPEKIEDLVVPKELSNLISSMLEGKSKAHDILLYGSAGTGKSTTAKMIVNTINAEYFWINGSKRGQNGVETINKIEDFMSYSPSPGYFHVKYVVIDEADYLTPNAFAALRGVMELLPEYVSFILTCNYINRIPENLKSRAVPIEFGIWQDKSEALKKFTKRNLEILKEEKITIKNVNKSITYFERFLPDFRRALGELQLKSMMYNNVIDFEVLVKSSEFQIASAMDSLFDEFNKPKIKFVNFRQWIANNEKLFAMLDSLEPVIGKIFENLEKLFDTDDNIAEAILILQKYAFQEKSVLNKLLCISSMITELALLKISK